MIEQPMLALYALLGLAFFLAATGAKLPLETLLRVVSEHGKVTLMLLALGMFLAFLMALTQQ